MSTPPEELPDLPNTYDRDVMPVREELDNELPEEDEGKAKAEQPTKRTAHRK